MYADKIRLKTLFDFPDSMITAESPVYGEKGVQIRYRCADLLIKRIGILVRFLAVLHPVRGRCILMCTDLSLPAIEVIKLDGLVKSRKMAFSEK